MKKNILSLIITAATFGLACLVAVPAWSADTKAPGITAQQERIAKGVRKGEITRREKVRLQREQARMQRHIRRARADGRIDRGERRHLSRMKNRADRHIYRARHNRDRYRNPAYRHHHRRPPCCRTCVVGPRQAFSRVPAHPGIALAWNINLH